MDRQLDQAMHKLKAAGEGTEELREDDDIAWHALFLINKGMSCGAPSETIPLQTAEEIGGAPGGSGSGTSSKARRA